MQSLSPSPPEFILDAFADPASVRDVVKGILHTIFFHRFIPNLLPYTREVLDLTLPYVNDVELETMIEQRAAALVRQLESERSSTNSLTSGGGGRGQINVQFFEKRRRSGFFRGDEEVCWECWTLKVTVAEPRTETERAKVRKAMEQTLLTTVMKIIAFTNAHKDHIPLITGTPATPFPYQININQNKGGWATRMGIY
ncbi:Autophagy-related protein 101 [Colletotrichum sidae]|uniref:Autophagy-related protein 101 n=1 Tax=Colletotrichum sidae TaxID=1347389 RepID=A0A4R8S9Y9_9PEZI|nr:Autophagy-related protein 101 [Colletotrichum sidae]